MYHPGCCNSLPMCPGHIVLFLFFGKTMLVRWQPTSCDFVWIHWASESTLYGCVFFEVPFFGWFQRKNIDTWRLSCRLNPQRTIPPEQTGCNMLNPKCPPYSPPPPPSQCVHIPRATISLTGGVCFQAGTDIFRLNCSHRRGQICLK